MLSPQLQNIKSEITAVALNLGLPKTSPEQRPMLNVPDNLPSSRDRLPLKGVTMSAILLGILLSCRWACASLNTQSPERYTAQ